MEPVTGQENGNTMNRKGERRTDRRHVRCPVCEDLPRGPLCKTHRRELAGALHGLRLGMYELKAVERREVRLASHGGGPAHPAFAPAAIDISAADLYNETSAIIGEVAGDIGIWGGGVPQLLTKLADKMGLLADAPNSGRDYRQLTNAYRRVKLRITPPEERIIHGHCLNPTCGRELAGVREDTMITCPACGSTWAVAEVRRARREKLAGRTITGTPTQIAGWVKKATGVPVKSQDVRNWLRRGLLAVKTGKGVYECQMVDLLTRVEEPHPGLKLTA